MAHSDETPQVRPHICVGGKESSVPSYWVNDGYGIPLTRVCSLCEKEKLAQFRPDILERYDADEPIDDDEGYGDYADEGDC